MLESHWISSSVTFFILKEEAKARVVTDGRRLEKLEKVADAEECSPLTGLALRHFLNMRVSSLFLYNRFSLRPSLCFCRYTRNPSFLLSLFLSLSLSSTPFSKCLSSPCSNPPFLR
ncbi:hypothetical protein PVL29_021544 [Vitis rotundifolia]|uniref:Uncharacterized protein n=1 Tax=Vitis rotundifolia TaxID=103349 RepID=A0AA38YZM9_VITRO|nr:hypothetical protein PVL29_021544 [Vitis rotundifolia]